MNTTIHSISCTEPYNSWASDYKHKCKSYNTLHILIIVIYIFWMQHFHLRCNHSYFCMYFIFFYLFIYLFYFILFIFFFFFDILFSLVNLLLGEIKIKKNKKANQRLYGCAGWSESSLGVHFRRYVFSRCGYVVSRAFSLQCRSASVQVHVLVRLSSNENPQRIYVCFPVQIRKNRG